MRFLKVSNEERLHSGVTVQRRQGVVLRVVLMFVDIVRRGERTTIISHHPLLPRDGGSTAENMKQREQVGAE